MCVRVAPSELAGDAANAGAADGTEQSAGHQVGRCTSGPERLWSRLDPATAAGSLCKAASERLRREDVPATPPHVAKRIVTVSPDVSSTTNLAGWLNKVGVWSPDERRSWFDDDAETIMPWREKPTGQHMELGIAETNLVGLISELVATWARWGQPLFPVGVLYDPFVERALEPWSFGIYAGGQSILVGAPAGVTLATEGGAHQSVRRHPSGSNSPDARATSPYSPSRSNGPCLTPSRGWAPRRWIVLPPVVHQTRSAGTRRDSHRPGRPRTSPPPGRRRCIHAAAMCPSCGDHCGRRRDRDGSNRGKGSIDRDGNQR
ncbi:MAG: pyruvate dehydrogenase component [Mycobacterium sp.]|nr:pyruvate dehydrogenase component [Mycobacterium sp.]